MTTQTQTPQPPLPPPSSSFHRLHRAASSSSLSLSTGSSASSSSYSTASSATSSRSPSPRSTTTSVPFSWEHHPGIPKNFVPADPASPPTPLPLPPPLRAPSSRHHHHRRRRRANHPPPAADPFAAALAECTRDRAAASGTGGDAIDTLFPAPAPAAATGGHAGRRWSIAAGGVVGFLDLHGCKSAMAVAEGAFIVRRPVAVARPVPGRAGQGRLGRAGRL